MSNEATGTGRPVWVRWDDLPEQAPMAGLTLRALTGDQLMANRVTVAPGTTIPSHQHPEEQIGIVLSGGLEVTIGDETRSLGPGEAFAIPADVPHGVVVGPAGATLLDVFTPPREAYRT